MYTVNIGCIRKDNSINSRDHCMPEEFKTKQLAQEYIEEKRSGWDRVGYKVWYCQIVNEEEHN